MATTLTILPMELRRSTRTNAGAWAGIDADKMVSRIVLPHVTMVMGRQDQDVSPTVEVRDGGSGFGRTAALADAIRALLNDMKLTRSEALQLIRDVLALTGNPLQATRNASVQVSDRVHEISQTADLTREETAKLLGVSRRALQNWLAGGPISAVRDRRLREVAAFVEEQSQRFGPATLRDRLYVRSSPRALRAFDLVSEGAFEAARAAIDAAADMASSAPIGMPPRPVFGLDARVIAEDGGPSQPAGKPSTRLRRRAVRS